MFFEFYIFYEEDTGIFEKVVRYHLNAIHRIYGISHEFILNMYQQVEPATETIMLN